MAQPLISHDYHYGNEAEQYTFYRLPKALFTDDNYKNLSDGAKILYGLMLDRMGLSIRNNWVDDNNRVYIYFTLEDLQEYMNCGHNKGVKIMSELDNIGLIERVKQGQGKPTIVFVKKFIANDNDFYRKKKDDSPGGNKGLQRAEVQTSENGNSKPPLSRNQDDSEAEMQTSESGNSKLPINGTLNFPKTEIQTSENGKCRLPISGNADFPKAESNYTNKNNTNFIDNNISQSSLSEKQKADGQDKDRTEDITQKIQAYTEIIKENISYSDLAVSRKFDIRLINEFINIMVDVILTNGKYVRIGGEDKPRELVKHTFLKLDYSDMEHAIDQFKSVTDRISKKKQYIISLLYNCKLEVDSHFTNLVKHDMYGGGLSFGE